MSAIEKVNSVTTPTATSVSYKNAILTNLLICEENILKSIQEIGLYINAIEEANLATEQEMRALTEGGTFDRVLNFFGALLDNMAMQDARDTEAALLAASAVAGMFDEQVADEMVSASQVVVNNANDIKNQQTGAMVISSVLNSLIAGLKGVMRFGESAIDGMVMTGAQVSNDNMVSSMYGLPYFLNNDIINIIEDLARENKKGAMEFVENNYTDTAFYELYEKEILKIINEKSYIKHGDMAYMVIEGVTYYVPMAVIDSVAPGSGITLNYFAGSGKAQQEVLSEMKMNSDEWTTDENFNKSNAIGASSGLWEGIQWLSGKQLVGSNDLVMTASKIVIDTFFNGMDVPYRSFVAAQIMEKNFSEEFESRGGVAAFATDALVGLVGSVLGEVVGANKSERQKHKQNKEVISEVREIMYDYFDNHPELNVSKSNIDESLGKIIVYDTRAEFEAKYVETGGQSAVNGLAGYARERNNIYTPGIM